MPRRDLSNRDEFGDFKNRYDEPLSQTQLNVRPFASDMLDIDAISSDLNLSRAEVIRAIVRHWILSYRSHPDPSALADALKKILT